jgi:hypothetical protein
VNPTFNRVREALVLIGPPELLGNDDVAGPLIDGRSALVAAPR